MQIKNTVFSKTRFQPVKLGFYNRGFQNRSTPSCAMLEICLTCRATPISARLSFRVYFSWITRQTAAGGQLCAKRHEPNYRISIAVEQADAGFNPLVKKKKSNKIVGPDRLLRVKASVSADSPVIIGCWSGAAASAPRSLGQLPNATRHQRTVMQAANSVH